MTVAYTVVSAVKPTLLKFSWVVSHLLTFLLLLAGVAACFIALAVAMHFFQLWLRFGIHWCAIMSKEPNGLVFLGIGSEAQAREARVYSQAEDTVEDQQGVLDEHEADIQSIKSDMVLLRAEISAAGSVPSTPKAPISPPDASEGYGVL